MSGSIYIYSNLMEKTNHHYSEEIYHHVPEKTEAES